jgi:hypothetical protein
VLIVTKKNTLPGIEEWLKTSLNKEDEHASYRKYIRKKHLHVPGECSN